MEDRQLQELCHDSHLLLCPHLEMGPSNKVISSLNVTKTDYFLIVHVPHHIMDKHKPQLTCQRLVQFSRNLFPHGYVLPKMHTC